MGKEEIVHPKGVDQIAVVNVVERKIGKMKTTESCLSDTLGLKGGDERDGTHVGNHGLDVVT
jgi:hypothetical protein